MNLQMLCLNKKNLKQSYNNYDKLISLGIGDIQKNNFAGAVKNFLNAAKMLPTSPIARILLSLIHI